MHNYNYSINNNINTNVTKNVSKNNANATHAGGGGSTPWQAFRLDEDVDIKDNGEDGYYIGWTDAGEYLRYTVDVQTGGERLSRFFGVSVIFVHQNKQVVVIFSLPFEDACCDRGIKAYLVPLFC